MAQYTVTLNEYASYIAYGELAKRKKALEEWLFYDHDYDMELKGKFQPLFVNRYLFEEMGFETPEMFRDRVNERLDEVIPYYEEMFQLNRYMLAWDFMEPDIEYSENGAGSESGSLEDDERRYAEENEGVTESRSVRDESGQQRHHAESNLNAENRKESGEDETANSRSESSASGTKEYSDENTENSESETNAQHELFAKTGEAAKSEIESSFRSRENENTLNGNSQNTGQKNTQDTDKQITEGNGAVSNYPQANVINGNNYYTSGNEQNQKVQKQNNGLETTSGSTQQNQQGKESETYGEGRSGSQSEASRNNENVSRSGTKGISGKITGIKDLTKNESGLLSANGLEFKKTSGGVWVNQNGTTSGSEEIMEMLSRMDALNRSTGRGESSRGRRKRDTSGTHTRAQTRRGRLERRPIPQIIREIENTYRNIPLEMTKEFEDLFMGIW